MARSISRMSRADKHQRLFELIRQGNLASQSGTRRASVPAPSTLQALRDRAEQSIRP
ncbi:hypothetical protein [Roseovarius faecimaris]|uniref:hypothetical protein n=1 Tax=Roseovarius faecimaris TaxID=2494550 RepID=UPI0012FE1CEE|nr:hypothetical protein [Roseovarius faecimaris]